jgi:hypothetical protein
MNTHRLVSAVEHHAADEWRIHRELFRDAFADMRKLARKHWSDTKAIHRSFFKEMKKAWRDL